MGKTYAALGAELQQWIAEQKVFFVATAPLASGGHINCSPKGSDTFRVIGEREVAYLDLTGSGIETVAHVRENGRIVIMFCAFAGPPKIVRLHGVAQAFVAADSEYTRLANYFAPHPGARTIIRVQVSRISDSCGYAVPLMEYKAQRTILDDWCERKGADGIAAYKSAKNAHSIDGLPGLAPTSAGTTAPASHEQPSEV